MKKENTIRESFILVIVMVVIVLVFTFVGYWDSVSDRRAKDREAYYRQTDSIMKRNQILKQALQKPGGSMESVNDKLNPKTKLSDLEKDIKKKSKYSKSNLF
ncbi:MAG: hypothetical protein P9L91_08190 [Candidatus Zophobacter franzmannii]|nr:hypothetical protein [Candidatus Zophobacter franzmannii]